jgi:hypothetical protein
MLFGAWRSVGSRQKAGHRLPFLCSAWLSGITEFPQSEAEVRYPEGGFLIKTIQGDQFCIFLRNWPLCLGARVRQYNLLKSDGI